MRTNSLISLDAERLLSLVGVFCIFATMILGYVYATYISHVANGGIKEAWSLVMLAVSQGDVEMVRQQFSIIADLAEQRGRITNSHSHLGGCGLLALGLASLQTLSSSRREVKNLMAMTVCLGVALQFAGVILEYYAGEHYIYLSDAGAIMLLVGVLGTLWGFISVRPGMPQMSVAEYAAERLHFGSSRLLLKAGILLMLVSMLLGVYLSWLMVSGEEAGSLASVSQSVQDLMKGDVVAAQASIASFKATQSKMAINAASHAHGLEMAIMMLLLATLRKSINISERWFRRWCVAFIAVSYLFPLWIFLAINYSFSFARWANYSGVALACLTLIICIGLLSGKKQED